jgi:hypothetical protein
VNFRTTQVNFSRGELGPQLHGRFDVDAWQSALALARNIIVLKYGGITKRPGTQLVAEVLDISQDNRIVPFQFSIDQTYALEMGQGYMSPCALGGRVLEGELAVTAITNAAQAQVTSVLHGYLPGDLAYFSGIDGAMGDLLNGRAWPVVAAVDANNFTIAADTSVVAVFSGAVGGEVRTVAPTEPTAPVVPPVVVPPLPPIVYIPGGGDFRYLTGF